MLFRQNNHDNNSRLIVIISRFPPVLTIPLTALATLHIVAHWEMVRVTKSSFLVNSSTNTISTTMALTYEKASRMSLPALIIVLTALPVTWVLLHAAWQKFYHSLLMDTTVFERLVDRRAKNMESMKRREKGIREQARRMGLSAEDFSKMNQSRYKMD